MLKINLIGRLGQDAQVNTVNGLSLFILENIQDKQNIGLRINYLFFVTQNFVEIFPKIQINCQKNI